MRENKKTINSTSLSPVKQWITNEDLNNIYSVAYWNDLKEEQKKEWWIADGNYGACIDFLESRGLMAEYKAAEKVIKKIDKKNLRIADLASGIGWTSALLSKLESVAEVHSVEISKHRIGELSEHSVKMLEGDPKKIHRYIGSFYETRFEDSSLDVVFLSQAFHHADHPFKLISECERILKPNGTIVLIGEHRINTRRFILGMIKYFLRKKKITFDFYELFPTDSLTGDHYYRRADYNFLFKSFGLDVSIKNISKEVDMYIIKKVI